MKFKTADGFTYDKNGVNILKLIVTQRVKFSKLSKERQERLKSIGFIVNACEEQWNANYRLAKNYCEYYGHAISLVWDSEGIM